MGYWLESGAEVRDERTRNELIELIEYHLHDLGEECSVGINCLARIKAPARHFEGEW
jgi:hypothetical protein